ncbi:MAG: mannose-1-phosphate guanylyltransferase [bacterium]
MIHVVIMAGGIGARFWPKSRRSAPKQLLDFFGEGTLIEETVRRALRLTSRQNVWIVTNRPLKDAIQKLLPEFEDSRFILEPVGKNTAPAIGLSAVMLARQDPDAVMVVLPADHRIPDPEAFEEAIHCAVAVLSEREMLATIGIHPTRPDTGYGYIQVDTATSLIAPDVYRVKTFAEKPNLSTAKLFLRSGDFLWNSGMFVWKASAILEQIAEFLPDLHSGLTEIAAALDDERIGEVVQRVYSSLRAISIDYGVMEKASNVCVVKGEFRWSDVGSWEEVWRLSEKDEKGNALCGGHLAIHSSNNLVDARDKFYALLGVDNLVVVETEDAVLICPRQMTQEVREIVDELERRKAARYL